MEGSQAIPLNPKRQKSAPATKSAPYLGFVPSKSAEKSDIVEIDSPEKEFVMLESEYSK